MNISEMSIEELKENAKYYENKLSLIDVKLKKLNLDKKSYTDSVYEIRATINRIYEHEEEEYIRYCEEFTDAMKPYEVNDSDINLNLDYFIEVYKLLASNMYLFERFKGSRLNTNENEVYKNYSDLIKKSILEVDKEFYILTDEEDYYEEIAMYVRASIEFWFDLENEY